MHLNKKYLVSIFLVAVGFSGCGPTAGRVSPASHPAVAPSIKTFALPRGTSLELRKDVTVFMWRPDMTPENVREVSIVADRVDQANEDRYEIDQTILKLEQTLAERQRGKQQELDNAKAEYRSKLTDLNEVKKEIRAEESKEKPDQQRLDELRKRQDALDRVVGDLKEEIKRLTAEMRQVGSDIATKIDALKIKQEAIEFEGQSAVNDLKNNVDYFEPQPELVVTRADSGELEIDLYHWGLDPSLSSGFDFSTSDSSIISAQYVDFGGVLRFEVVQGDDHYRFELARSNYGSQSETGQRIHFRGEIVKTDSDGLIRYGKAKFSSR